MGLGECTGSVWERLNRHSIGGGQHLIEQNILLLYCAFLKIDIVPILNFLSVSDGYFSLYQGETYENNYGQ